MARSSRNGSACCLLALGLGLGSGCDQSASREARPIALRPAAAAAPAGAEVAPAVDPAVPAAMAPPASREGLTADEQRRFSAAVSEGRHLHHVGDYEGAAQAYERALDLVPGDAKTLSEQGWALIFGGRLDEAEAALRRAEAGVGDDRRLHASILYNLGRAAEARGDGPAAIEAYQRSLRLRPHPAAYEHLTGLPGGTRYAFGPEVRPLQGPYARLTEFCAEERRLSESRRGEEDAESFGCLPDAARGLGGTAVEVPRARSLPAPWEGLRFVEVRPNPYAVRFHAALRTAAGWFVLADVAALARGTAGTTERATRLAASTEALVGGGAPEVVLEVETRWAVTEDGRTLESETHRVEFLCGLGPSGVPSCTGALPRATQARRREGGSTEHTRWTVERLVHPHGELVLSGEVGALDEPAAAVLGVHPLEFL